MDQQDKQLPAIDEPTTRTEAENVFLERERRKFSDYAAATLDITEAAYVVVDSECRIEYKAFSEEQALELAHQRVQRVGGPHVVFKRSAVVRPPKADVEVDRT